MASIINASATGVGGVITTADASGVLQLQSNGTTIATISPTGLSTQVGAPAFSAYGSANQILANATFTKVQLNLEEFDTNSNFNTALYRFTPTVAGYYQINGCVYLTASTIIAGYAFIYKNGVLYKYGSSSTMSSGQSVYFSVVSTLVYMNGTTDYLELYTYNQGTGTLTAAYGQSFTYFNGSMVRSA